MSSAKLRPFCPGGDEIRHCGWLTHICISKLDHRPDNGLSLFSTKPLSESNADLFFTGPLRIDYVLSVHVTLTRCTLLTLPMFIIIWTNIALPSRTPLINTFKWNFKKSTTFLPNKINMYMSSAEWRPFHAHSCVVWSLNWYIETHTCYVWLRVMRVYMPRCVCNCVHGHTHP